MTSVQTLNQVNPADLPSIGSRRNSSRILFLGAFPPPYGGIATHLQSLVPFLVAHGFAADVVSPGEERRVEQQDGFTVFRLTKGKGENLRRMMRGIPSFVRHLSIVRSLDAEFFRCQAIARVGEEIVRQRLAKIDVISAYHLLPWGLAGALLSRTFGIPLVVTNFGEIYAAPNLYRRKVRELRFILGEATRVVSSSRHCARSYELLGLCPQVDVIPYGIDVTLFCPERDGRPIRERLGVTGDEKVILFVGRLIRDMGLHTFLDAIRGMAARAESMKFVIVGGKGDLLPQARALQSLDPGRVFVACDVPFSELALYYAAADVVVAPTTDERACMGLAIKEAMATGKPVIATRVGGVPEAVVDGETGVLIEPENPRALGEAIAALVGDPRCMRAMGIEGRQRALKMFNTDLTNQTMMHIFQEVIGN